VITLHANPDTACKCCQSSATTKKRCLYFTRRNLSLKPLCGLYKYTEKKEFVKRLGKGYASNQFKHSLFRMLACPAFYAFERAQKGKICYDQRWHAERYSVTSAQLQQHSYFVHMYGILILLSIPSGKKIL